MGFLKSPLKSMAVRPFFCSLALMFVLNDPLLNGPIFIPNDPIFIQAVYGMTLYFGKCTFYLNAPYF